MNTIQNPVPETMRAIRQHEAGGKLMIEKVPVPQPGPGEVLVRMAASPINPSDLAMLEGGYMTGDYPYTPGLEGSGTVVSTGGGLFPALRNGKRVACSPNPEGDGTWAEYMTTSAMRTLPLPPSISLEQGAMMLVNPMTAMAFIYLAKEGKHRAIINNAAASSLGKMLIRLTLLHGIPLINIVRKEQHVGELKEMGASHVLNSTAESFESDLSQLSNQLGATLILDAVTGDQSSVLLRATPTDTKLVAYARLSGNPISADPSSLMMDGKQIEGFQLGRWLHTKSIPFKLRFSNKVKKLMESALTSKISQTFPMEEVETALMQYRENMSDGKIILNLHTAGMNEPT